MMLAATCFVLLVGLPEVDAAAPAHVESSDASRISFETKTGAEWLYLRDAGVEMRGTAMSASLLARYVLDHRLALILGGRASLGRPRASVDGERVPLHPNAGYLTSALLAGAELRDGEGWYARALIGRSGFLFYSPAVAGLFTGGFALSAELGRRFAPTSWLRLGIAGNTRVDRLSDGAWALFTALEGSAALVF